MLFPRKELSPKQLMNERAMKIYAASICGLILAGLVAKLLRHTWVRSRPTILRQRFTPYISITANPAVGHWLLIGPYLAVNVIFGFVSIDSLKINILASRAGWLALANLPLCVFLGLKNTPLALLSDESYNKLNVFHRVVGLTIVIQVVLHAILYTSYFCEEGKCWELIQPDNWEGLVAGAAMLVLGLGFFRSRNYELFYVSHILGFVTVVAFMFLHRPDWVKKVPVVVAVTVGLWACDRIFRAARMLFNLVNNEVTLYPLPDGGVRLHMKKALARARPGSHCFVWIPHVRLFQTHPFSIIHSSPSGLDMVLKAQDGFTKRAHELASVQPGLPLKGSVEGPYGSAPVMTDYEKVILVGGGSGASFTFGVASLFVEQFSEEGFRSMDFIWAVKTRAYLSWYEDDLASLSSHRHVSVHLYITQEGPHSTTTTPTAAAPESSMRDEEKIIVSSAIRKTVEDADTDLNPNMASEASSVDHVTPFHGKLDVQRSISTAIQHVKKGERVLVIACGPRSLVAAVRVAVSNERGHSGLPIELHCEQFDI